MALKSLNLACKGHLLTLQFLSIVDVQMNSYIRNNLIFIELLVNRYVDMYYFVC